MGAVRIVLVVTILSLPSLANAIPMSYSGALSYGYGYVNSGNDSEAESSSLTLNLNVTGFIWRPWFITYTAGGSLGFARAKSTTSETAKSVALAGNLGFNVFPSSRFPFSLLISRSDSTVENRSALNTLGSTNYTASRILLLQTYKGKENFLTNFSWSYSQFESDASSSESNALNYDARYRKTKYAWMAGASYNETSNSDSAVRPQNFTARANHNYVPGNQLGVTSSVSYNHSNVRLASGSSQTSVAQASSVYSWRPEHKPYSFSGGVRVSASESNRVAGDSESNAMSLSLGLNYRLTRKINVSSSGTVSAAETDGDNTSSAAANVSTGYNSDQYDISGFRYNWRTSGGYSYSTSESDNGNKQQNSNVSFSLGHTAAKNWALGRTSAMSFSLSQSGGLGYSGDQVGSATVGHSVGLNASSNDRKGSTFLGASLTDTRSCTGECDSAVDAEAQFFAVQFARNQGINRLSSLTGNASYQWGRQKKLQEIAGQPGQEESVKSYTRSANMNANYHHLRAFGVYALNYTSAVSYSRNFNVDDDARDTLTWENQFTYVIGLLDTSLNVDFVKQGEDVRGSLSFRATRNF